LCSDRVAHPRHRTLARKPQMGKALSSPAPLGRGVTLREHTQVISRECRSGWRYDGWRDCELLRRSGDHPHRLGDDSQQRFHGCGQFHRHRWEDLRQERHDQHRSEHCCPCRVPPMCFPDAQNLEQKQDNSSQNGAADTCFNERVQAGVHFPSRTFLASRSNWAAVRIFSSTMPARKTSTEPAQKRWMICRTLLAASFRAGMVAL